MKVLPKLVPLALGALLLTTLTAPTASAVSRYEGQSPWKFFDGQTCAADGEVGDTEEIVRGGTVYGTVSIWWSARCRTRWATVNFGTPMAANTWGIAYLTREHANDGKTVRNCDSPNGNKHVVPGQTTCFTPMLVDADVIGGPLVTTFYAQGHEYHPQGTGWYIHATGKTDSIF